MRNTAILLVVFLAVYMFGNYFAEKNLMSGSGSSSYSYERLESDIAKNKVKSIEVVQNAQVPTGSAIVKLNDGEKKVAHVTDVNKVIDLAQQYKVSCQVDDVKSSDAGWLSMILPWIVIGVIMMFMFGMISRASGGGGGGNKMMNFGKSRATMISPDARNRTIAFYAPSKTFNLAGLVGSYHIVFNRMLRDRLEAKSRKSHYNTMNVLSMHALIGAYEAEGYTWVNELCQVLSENVEYAVNHIRDYYRGINVSKPQGTYMLFLDCEDWCEENYKSLDELLKAGWDVGVAWQDGRPFHQEYGIRMNLALPLSRVKEAFERLDEYVFHV